MFRQSPRLAKRNSEETAMRTSFPLNASSLAHGAALAACALAGILAAATIIPAFAEPGANDEIPQFASANFGWQTNVADWQEPPAGFGHGPIKADPAHPFVSNAEAGRRGIQPTLRIGDVKD